MRLLPVPARNPAPSQYAILIQAVGRRDNETRCDQCAGAERLAVLPHSADLIKGLTEETLIRCINPLSGMEISLPGELEISRRWPLVNSAAVLSSGTSALSADFSDPAVSVVGARAGSADRRTDPAVARPLDSRPVGCGAPG